MNSPTLSPDETSQSWTPASNPPAGAGAARQPMSVGTEREPRDRARLRQMLRPLHRLQVDQPDAGNRSDGERRGIGTEASCCG